MTEALPSRLRALLDLLAARLVATPAAAPFAAPLRELDVAGADAAGRGTGAPVADRLPAALDGAPTTVSALARALAELAPALAWTQTDAYRRQPPSPGFLDGYGYAVLCGPASVATPLIPTDTLACGVLVLAPGIVYPAHAHPAAEVYVPLTPGTWRRGDGSCSRRPAGDVVVHAPDEPHAMCAGEVPLVALYVWLGDLATSARILRGPDGSPISR